MLSMAHAMADGCVDSMVCTAAGAPPEPCRMSYG